MFAVAIDGPSGAGKSSVARQVAKKLGFLYVDTGAIYRTVALGLIRGGVDLSDEAAVESFLPSLQISVRRMGDEQRMFLGGVDVSDEIRSPEVTHAASVSAALPSVRAFLLAVQRRIAAESDVIMDGRDIGTVVLPDAKVKIFLTASPEERAARRVAQMRKSDMHADFDTVLADIRARDERDSTREIAPLKPSQDSVVIDSSDITRDETVGKILAIVKAKRG